MNELTVGNLYLSNSESHPDTDPCTGRVIYWVLNAKRVKDVFITKNTEVFALKIAEDIPTHSWSIDHETWEADSLSLEDQFDDELELLSEPDTTKMKSIALNTIRDKVQHHSHKLKFWSEMCDDLSISQPLDP